ncbi:MAG: hypothetical protein ACYTEQ_10910 [Planctomycetota bacterium]|jgi:hypothetical protein
MGPQVRIGRALAIAAFGGEKNLAKIYKKHNKRLDFVTFFVKIPHLLSKYRNLYSGKQANVKDNPKQPPPRAKELWRGLIRIFGRCRGQGRAAVGDKGRMSNAEDS